MNILYGYKQLLSFLLIALCSCKQVMHNKQLTATDTTAILNTVVLSPSFEKKFKTLTPNPDTLFIIKEDQFYKNWHPPKTLSYHLAYIEDIDTNKAPITSPLDDHRQRLGIAGLKFKKDTAELIIFNFSSNRDDHYLLTKKKLAWQIVKTYYGVN